MSDTEDADHDERFEPDEQESAALRGLLKRSLSLEAMAKEAPALLPGVQRRIRRRSRGRFFNDGWSTAQSRTTYILAGIITLALATMAYLVLSPWNVQ